MRRPALAVLLTGLLFAVHPLASARASGLPRPDLPDAQTLIEACWDTSKALRESHDPAQQHTGFDETTNCLDDTIMRLLDELHFGNTELSRPAAREELAKLRVASRQIYRMIYRDDLHCTPSCPEISENWPLAAHAAILEEIIRTLVWAAATHTDQTGSIKPASRPMIDAWNAISVDEPDLLNPKVIVDHCWKISEEDRAGNNSQIREGNLKTVLCLEAAVVDLYDKLSYENSSLTKKQLRADLVTIRFALGRFYWLIYNDSEYCGMFCGSIWYSAHLPPISAELITMINTMTLQAISRRKETMKH